MNKKSLNFLSIFSLLVVVTGSAIAAQSPNPRSSGVSTARMESPEVKRTTSSVADEQVSRSATKRTTAAVPRTATVPTTQGVVTSRSAARQTVVSSNGRVDTVAARTAKTPSTTTARSAQISNTARSASKPISNISRSAARATAVYDDVSKMGTGYANCRDAYNTCMDQFCAKSNETYRRCYCSSKITDFRSTEAGLDEAKLLLMQFEDNNLNAIDKTAAEVDAMYSATVGEQAIKNDTSAAQKTLSDISDLLSGKKKVESSKTNTSLGLSLDFSVDLDDIWSGGSGSSNSIFNTNAASSITGLEGQELYNAAHKQCQEIIKGSCENSAVTTMAVSSYNILIGQDCNAYEKSLNTKKQAVMQTVRQAEKILREARLDEYRSHNSADVNECIANVKAAITADTACGQNYKKCLDYTGLYIDINTGEPIYSPQLFKLTEILNLNIASGDIAGGNQKFNQFLDGKKMFAEKALDSCRDKADIVWSEFKRSAMIEIAQAQDAKIEEVKSSCVTTMKECYDGQSGQLASFDDTTAKAAGALSAYAARAMCSDKVVACAALYPGPECKFDTNGRLTTPQCGMQALMDFVQTVDNVKVAEGCEVGMRNFVESLCAPASGDTHVSPWGCRLMAKSAGNDNYTPGETANTISKQLQKFAFDNCTDPSAAKPASYNEWSDSMIKTMVDTTQRKILEDIDYVLYDECEEAEGLWVTAEELISTDKPEQKFYVAAFAGRTPDIASKTPNDAAGTSWGYCIQNTVKYQCIAQDESTGGNGYAIYNPTSNTCTFTDEWYKIKCEGLGGYYDGGVCYV